ncbi:MAG: hypothetical protein OXL96_25670 [Candidatus Poribacteria bacterium]|nr:hypothetical protein [Candidatus Poribacteria bacterium]
MNNFLSHFYPFLRRTRGLLIAGAFLLIGVFFLYRSSGVRRDGFHRQSCSCRCWRACFDVPPVDFDSDAYYRPIIAYNLFHPLGWTPPRPTELYRLISTILPRSANTPPKAIIQSIARNKTHIVTTDDNLEVVEIQTKQILLEIVGQQKTLRLKSGFLQRT